MDEQKDFRAYICCGPNCSLKHSSRLVDVLQREVDAAGLEDKVEVMPGSCQKHCERGISMVVWPGRIYYELMDERKIRRIVREHLGAGRPVRELFYVEPDEAYLERERNRRLEIQRNLQERLSHNQPDRQTQRPAQQPQQKKRDNRPSWRRSEGDVDDFKW